MFIKEVHLQALLVIVPIKCIKVVAVKKYVKICQKEFP